MKIGWRLGITLMLLGGGAAALHMAPPVKAAVNPAPLFALPMTLAGWAGTDGVLEDVLPRDPSEKASVRRTYRSGNGIAWVSVSLFVSQDEEARRGSINKIYPQRQVSLIETVPFETRVGASAGRSVPLPAVVVHHESGRLLVAYWHQIGPSVYGSEYRFRLALMRDLIFTRRADTLLVRIAVPARAGAHFSESLGVVDRLASPLYAALVLDSGQ